MNYKRFISPYFSTIGLHEAILLLKGVFLCPFINAEKQRGKLHQLISGHFKAKASFSFTSARGALASCLKSMGVGPGDDVLVSTFTCLAVPTSIVALGARPIYAEINPKTLNVTLHSIQKVITSKTKVIIVQHTLGSSAPIQEIIDFVKGKGIYIIEDCALALGTTCQDTEVGTTADASIFSMELSKTLTVGWGGILVINNENLLPQVEINYINLKEESKYKTFRKAIQTAITGICYIPNFFKWGRYVVALGFKTGFFKPSTPILESKGIIGEDYISKLAFPQVFLAYHQWNRIHDITRICYSNGNELISTLQDLGYNPLGNFSNTNKMVSPRVSFIVKNRPKAISWFYDRGIELGTWFDGPLSPLPTETVFNYERESFPNAIFIADHIVNLPCHFRIEEIDLIYLKQVLNEYDALNKENISLQKELNHFNS
ncbi:DegT/DnrJ/EryC1/StrS family aminotransferase [Aquirufa nivalisilvae]